MTKKKRFALGTALVIIAAAALTAAATLGGDSHKSIRPVAQPADDSPLMTAPPTTAHRTTTRATTTTVPLSKIPKPAAPPADPYAPTPIVQIGVLEIPKIGEVTPIYEGITLTVIDHGPGHWPGSALPGQVGNTVFPGHRVTHTHPFLNLDLLSPGDQIVFHMPHEDYVYKVSGTQIVYPTDVWVTNPTTTPTVTLIACHPKHSAAQRIVVKGYLAASIPRPA